MCALNAVMAAGEADRTQSQMIMIGNWLASPNIRAPGRGEIPVEIGPSWKIDRVWRDSPDVINGP